jgi:hypothetical protein
MTQGMGATAISAYRTDIIARATADDSPSLIGLPLNKGQDFGFTPNKRPDYRKPIATWAY